MDLGRQQEKGGVLTWRRGDNVTATILILKCAGHDLGKKLKSFMWVVQCS